MARTVDELVAFLRAHAPTVRLELPERRRPDVVRAVTLDSRRVRPGDLFAGLPGAHAHGAESAHEAWVAGAVALLSDRASPELPSLVVPDPRRVLGPLAAWLRDDPSHALAVHGVTGTNGKTSTVHLLDAALRAAGRRTGTASSLVVRTGDDERPAERTTAEAPDVQDLLARCRAAAADDVTLEVSSHGLALHRVAGTRFRTAVFTNLSPDHLDLHTDLENYYAAKASLFTPDRAEAAVVVVDDDAGRRLAAWTACPLTTVSATGRPADWRALDVATDASGTTFRACGPDVDLRVRLRVLGAHQVPNALAALAAAVGSGADPAAAVRGLEGVHALPGRLEVVDAGQPFLALVDFAHNVGGHLRVLPFLRRITPGRLVVVLGATGGRDRSKRTALGRCVAERADLVVVTDESPHDEEPAALRAAVAAGAHGARGARVVTRPGRRAAIAHAVGAAGPGDTVLVAGRGADPALVRADTAEPFDDREVLLGALRAVL
ncbi:Mur ligase family protein [Actinomycetospora soli]|uniref:Mur ligase family protein n=1 Tax=Actinomycetospora soli TaxID=2893887 RepID=UPI001E2B31A9|nr:UDP-N-acetylmuramoyl-L-alanyl-D-glutamate--2,6-diaminopimelate ligase [Actinomycetospora soli]MCD2188818.1 UDP-N-acetylmuramoyl-L-alanyl-D-glutamate--2,6-diaminopimelate ligase [Actinomycetospora soli]